MLAIARVAVTPAWTPIFVHGLREKLVDHALVYLKLLLLVVSYDRAFLLTRFLGKRQAHNQSYSKNLHPEL